jgi:hypothetical protein
MGDSEDLKALLRKANGADIDIDRAIAARFAVAPADYSSSVDQCRSLVNQLLPGWRLHLGYGASGIFPYASLAKGDEVIMAEAPTLPLAVLRALFAAPLPRDVPTPPAADSSVMRLPGT